MKRSYPLTGILAAAILAMFANTSAQAQTSATVSLNASSSTPFVYQGDFDVLALDFTVHSAVGDTLKALTVAKQGSARDNTDFMKVKLWADKGVAGFQGFGYDQVLAEGSLVTGLWVFKGFEHSFTHDAQRYFVSLEAWTSAKDSIAQFEVLMGGDDGDGVYETGEQGIFLKSGVIASVPNTASSHVLSFKADNRDIQGAKAFLKNVSVDASSPTLKLNPVLPITLAGEARDRLIGSVQSVKLMVNGQELPATSMNGTNFAEWSASYTPAFAKEELTITIKTLDGASNAWTSEAYYLTIDQRVPSSSRSTFVATPGTIGNDGLTSAELRLTLLDEVGSALDLREVRFETQRERLDDSLDKTTVTTDAAGNAVVKLTSSMSGVAEVDAYVGSTLVATVTVVVGEGIQEPQPEEPEQPAALQAGDLIKGSQQAVYYFGSDGKRHVFVHQDMYFSWYGNDFSKVKTISDDLLASLPLGPSVPFKPGSLIKVPSVPNVYVVDFNQTLRHVTTEALASQMFGSSWNKSVRDLSEALLTSYTFGGSIVVEAEFSLSEINALPRVIDDELSV